MNKKVVIALISMALLIVIIIPLILFNVLTNGNPYTKYIVDKKVPLYLESQGYSDSHIEESYYIEPKHMIDSKFYQGHYMVIFKDEPQVTYYYGVTKEGKQVKQFCEKDKESSAGVTDITEENTKHSEEQCANSL